MAQPAQYPVEIAARHEAFAQQIANGLSTREAFKAIGLSSSPTNYSQFARNPNLVKRVQELVAQRLMAAGVTAERTKHEIARVAYADVRKIFTADGQLKPIHEIDDDTAAAITSITVQRKNIGTQREPEFVDVMKIKFASKMDALGLLAKHFKLVNDEGDGVNALANALADRLNSAKRRVVEPVEDVAHRMVPGVEEQAEEIPDTIPGIHDDSEPLAPLEEPPAPPPPPPADKPLHVPSFKQQRKLPKPGTTPPLPPLEIDDDEQLF
jgi:phage terminase small subunit